MALFVWRSRGAAHNELRIVVVGGFKVPALARWRKADLNGSQGGYVDIAVMILPQVHLRKPCYDFYFL